MAERSLVGLQHFQGGLEGSALALGGGRGALVVVELTRDIRAGLFGRAEFLDRGRDGGLELTHAARKVGGGRFGVLGGDQLAAGVNERGFQFCHAARQIGIGGRAGPGSELLFELGDAAGEVRIFWRGGLRAKLGQLRLKRGVFGGPGPEILGGGGELCAHGGQFLGGAGNSGVEGARLALEFSYSAGKAGVGRGGVARRL